MRNSKQTVEDKECVDTILLKQIADGDRNAFTELYKNYQPRLIKFCCRMLKNDVALAADMADEALIEVWFITALNVDSFDCKIQDDWLSKEE